MIFRRLLYAPNVHQGGGKTLLTPLLEALKDATDVAFILDERIQLPEGFKFAGNVYYVKATLASRLLFEWQLRNLIGQDSLLLCMGNLPPLFAHQGHQMVFMQNRYLIDDISLEFFSLLTRLRLMVERWWLRSRSSYVKDFIVQTATMQRLMKKALNIDAKILPFTAGMADIKLRDESDEKQYDFLYVASGEPHKNHERLIEAWMELAERGEFPSLCLTLDVARFPDLCGWINSVVKKHSLQIFILGECSHMEVMKLYNTSRALIFPSLFESFGLPLIEAVMLGLPVLTGNLSFVIDVIRPTDQFDPLSPNSIADAVIRFSFEPAILSVKLFTVDEFLQQTLNRDDCI